MLLQLLVISRDWVTQGDKKGDSFKSKYIPILLGRSDKFDIYDYFNFARFITFGREKMRQYFKSKGIVRIERAQFVECTSPCSQSCSTPSARTMMSSSGNPSTSSPGSSPPERTSTWPPSTA